MRWIWKLDGPALNVRFSLLFNRTYPIDEEDLGGKKADCAVPKFHACRIDLRFLPSVYRSSLRDAVVVDFDASTTTLTTPNTGQRILLS